MCEQELGFYNRNNLFGIVMVIRGFRLNVNKWIETMVINGRNRNHRSKYSGLNVDSA